MSDRLTTLLQTDSHRETLFRRFQKPGACVLLEGPSGAGKTTLAHLVADDWTLNGGAAATATGDEASTTRRLFPFLVGLSKQRDYSTAKKAASAIAATADQVLFGKPLSTTLELFLDWQDAQRKRRQLFLAQDEMKIVSELERRAKKRQLLIVADNLQWWDQASIDLLDQFLAAPFQKSFPFLQKTRVLLILNTSAVMPDERSTRLRSGLLRRVDSRHELTYVGAADYPVLLRSLGLRITTPAEVLNQIYQIVGGNLLLAKKLVDLLNSDDYGEDLLNRSTVQDLLFTHRFKDLDREGGKLLKNLGAASILGSQFSRTELLCILGNDQDEVAKTIALAKSLEILEVSGEAINFTHDSVRDYFTSRIKLSRPLYHRQLAECLRLLRPSEYLLRARHLAAAEMPDTAQILATVSILQDIREGRIHRLVPSLIREAPGYGDYLQRMLLGYELRRHGNYLQSYDEASRIDSAFPEFLLAERDYLRALSVLDSYSTTDRGTAIDILESWSALRCDEAEVDSRFGFLLIHALLLRREYKLARRQETKVTEVLSRRQLHDPSAKVKLHILNRRANSLYPSDIATQRIKKAADFFLGDRHSDSVSYPVELFKSLVNLGGCLIQAGDFARCLDACREVDALLNTYSEFQFPRLDLVLNNYIISLLRADAISPREAVDRQMEVLESPDGREDSLILVTNLGAYQAMSGDVEGGLNAIKKVRAAMVERGQDDPYAHIYSTANLASIHQILGQRDASLREHRRLYELAESSQAPTAPFLRRRQELFLALYDEIDASTIDTCLLSRFPSQVGPGWSHFGRGFLLSDLQFWSEG